MEKHVTLPWRSLGAGTTAQRSGGPTFRSQWQVCLSLKFLFIYVFIFGCAGPSLLLGLFSSCRDLGLLSSCYVRLLTVVASHVIEHRLSGAQASVMATHGLSGCGSWALEQRLSGCGSWALEKRLSGCGPWDLEQRLSGCGSWVLEKRLSGCGSGL